MNKHSILLKISIFFLLAIIATTALFKVMYDFKFESEKEILRIHYHHVAMSIMRWKVGDTTKAQLDKALKKDHMEVVNDAALYKNIQKIKKFDTVSCAKGDFHMYEKDSFRYVLVPKVVGKILLKDIKTESINVSYVWWLYFAFIFIMLLLFASIAISLYPLKKLQKQIRQFGEGGENIDFSSSRHDEIADVANEFSKAAKKINDVTQARIIFLRNVSHEFKTPITNGKLALEFIQDSNSKNILNNVFTRLDLLLKEFIEIEKITAIKNTLEKKNYQLADILDQATDILFLEQNTIANNFTTKSVHVNFELFSIVFKNLIDNALKYSDKDTLYIQANETEIHFICEGEKLDETLEYYLQPFTKSDAQTAQSFGLGLYIVDSILKEHKYSLSYSYENHKNCFTIEI
ncbi:MAG: ArsS family sensor histidine kinase [Sulfurimonas sp.]|nr:ArsS family sensor histidine kinase [Sulfurimonas sp.]